jgi:hypothetical protein
VVNATDDIQRHVNRHQQYVGHRHVSEENVGNGVEVLVPDYDTADQGIKAQGENDKNSETQHQSQSPRRVNVVVKMPGSKGAVIILEHSF